MRWLAVWLLLTGVYFAGQLATCLAAGAWHGDWSYTRESLAHLATVPLAQMLALRVVAWVRAHARPARRPRVSPPQAPETPASRPAAEP